MFPGDFVLVLSLLSAGFIVTHAATLEYNYNITWVNANPDGLKERPVIGINNRWPIEPLIATKGDRVIVHVTNQLDNETTSLHWHGIYQNGTTHMDGPVGVTQCEIPIGGSFTYNFTVSHISLHLSHSGVHLID
jgi:iron transport multicopper oxidase